MCSNSSLYSGQTNASKLNSDLINSLTKLASDSTSFGLFLSLYLIRPFTSCSVLLQYWILGNSTYMLCCLSCQCLCLRWPFCLECPYSFTWLTPSNPLRLFLRVTPSKKPSLSLSVLLIVLSNPLSNSIVTSMTEAFHVAITYVCHWVKTPYFLYLFLTPPLNSVPVIQQTQDD